ncbi:hypothetical protein BT63DRAFT_412456 [Microthyrium microscopicum]|uniref:Uncharacterized protein n=1 Tax=Microthyrium microscopicum TaxID=703497 RepID=A0A6A6UIX5_9PEZI|nr:hypothetical protein BT63DRAFT_412456 [Microthyrium microscopicum]
MADITTNRGMSTNLALGKRMREGRFLRPMQAVKAICDGYRPEDHRRSQSQWKKEKVVRHGWLKPTDAIHLSYASVEKLRRTAAKENGSSTNMKASDAGFCLTGFQLAGHERMLLHDGTQDFVGSCDGADVALQQSCGEVSAYFDFRLVRVGRVCFAFFLRLFAGRDNTIVPKAAQSESESRQL